MLLLLAASAPADQLGGAFRGGGFGPQINLGAPPRRPPPQDDILAFWPFWFEHNKEWLLSDRIRARRADAGFLRAEHRAEVVPVLIECTRDDSSFVRDAAVLALGKLGGPDVVKPIAARLEPRAEWDVDVRRSALLALGLTKEEAAIPVLRARLSNRSLRSEAAIGLALLGVREVAPELLELYRAELRAPPDDHAAALAVALGALGGDEIANEIAAPLLRRDPQRREQVPACHAMSLLDSELSRKWLLRALASRDSRVVSAANFGLCVHPGKIEMKYVSGKWGAKSGNRMSKLAATVNLGIMGSRLPEDDPRRRLARDTLLDCSATRAKDFYASMWASLALGFLGGEKARDALRQNLEAYLERGAKVRDVEITAVIMGLGFLGDRASAPRIRSLLEDPGQAPEVRGYAAFALGIMGDHESLDAIRGLLMAGWRHPYLVRPALWAVGLLGDEDDVPWLIEGLKVRGPEWHTVRGAAVIAIGLVGGSDAVRRLVRFIGKAEDNTDRAFAIAALGMLLDQDPVPRIPLLFRNYHYRELPWFARHIMWRL